jgi:hypothetical protein
MGAVHKQFRTVFVRDLTAVSRSIVGRMTAARNSARALGFEGSRSLHVLPSPVAGAAFARVDPSG